MDGDYRTALEAAGLEIVAMEYFGSYQGDIVAVVKHDNETKVLITPFGSCTGCDAYEAEFGWDDPTPARLKAFGEQYIEELTSPEHALAQASKNLAWCYESEAVVEFIQKHSGVSNVK